MRTLLVHNPTAGRGDHEKQELLAAFRAAGYDPHYCSTKSDAFPDILGEPFEAVAVAGGDGTVRKVAIRIEDRARPLIVVPLGTANNIARSLGLELQSLRPPPASLIAKARTRMDLGFGKIGSGEPRPLVEGIGMGALAATMDEKVGKGEKGEDKIVAARQTVARLLAKAEPFKASVTLDGRLIEGEFLFVEVLLHRYSGPALPLCPPADSGDGALDVVLLDDADRDEMVAWTEAPENSDPPVRIERGKHAVLEWSRKPALRFDDKRIDIPGNAKSIEIRVQDQPLTILTDMDAAETPAKARKKRRVRVEA